MSDYPDFSTHGYQVIQELGRNREGGRITYLATNISLDSPQQVVIKEFRFAAAGANWSGFKAYEREIEVLQALKHPRIPRYLSSFETQAGFCLVQEYKNAPSLAQRHNFEPEDIKQIAISILEILIYLQKRIPPVIHRDIKPENILVGGGDRENCPYAYLVDFGFARIRGGELAISSVAAGTPGFMPPEEQFGRSLTEASDLYSLGATLICLLTGTRSVDVGTLIDDDYRFDFKSLVPQLSPSFISWLEKMVAPNVKQRYANAADALEALKPISVVGGAIELKIPVRVVKHRKPSAVMGLVSLGAVAGVGTTLMIPSVNSPVTQSSFQASLVKQLLETKECRGCNLVHANLNGVDLKGADLEGANLEYANLEGANLEKTNLEGANLRNAHLWRANLKNANLENAHLWRANLWDANLKSTNLESVELGYANLGSANLRAANLEGVNLGNADLEGANLGNANLEGANLEYANLKGADLEDANLEGVNLEGANLEGADLEGATMPNETEHE